MTRSPGQPEFADDAPVLVSPRYLAGETPPEDLFTILGFLRQNFDWNVDPEHNVLSSPDDRSTIVYAPQREDGRWWHVAHRGHWSAEFSRNTPVEAFVGILWRLPQLSGDDWLIGILGEIDELSDVAGTASTYDWRPTETGWTSPDGHVSVAHDADADPAWRFTHSTSDPDAEWNATFSRTVPEKLVSAFLQHLAKDTPVKRRYGSLPRTARDHAFITPDHAAADAKARIDHAIAGVQRRINPPQGPRRHR